MCIYVIKNKEMHGVDLQQTQNRGYFLEEAIARREMRESGT